MGVGPTLEFLQAVDEGVAYRVRVEVGHVEHFDARLFKNIAVKRRSFVCEIG